MAKYRSWSKGRETETNDARRLYVRRPPFFSVKMSRGPRGEQEDIFWSRQSPFATSLTAPVARCCGGRRVWRSSILAEYFCQNLSFSLFILFICFSYRL